MRQADFPDYFCRRPISQKAIGRQLVSYDPCARRGDEQTCPTCEDPLRISRLADLFSCWAAYTIQLL